MAEQILNVQNLSVSFITYAGEVQAVRDVSFDIEQGETLAIVGESGCGKSVTVQTIMKLNPSPPAIIKSGIINFMGQDIVPLSEKKMESIRGAQISMIFQDPMTCLDPTMQIGKQVAETLVKHERLRSGDAFHKSIELLSMVGIPNAETRAKQYPHQFSGGMRQRAMIAMALACNPKLLIADEPTTALDVTIQAQILDLMRELKKKIGTSIILITHDLGIVASMADRVAVMYGGKFVEVGNAREIFYNPQHPYTWGLLDSRPRVDRDRSEPLIPIEGMPPDLIKPPVGCPFSDRCKYCMNVCKQYMPAELPAAKDHSARCWLMNPMAPQVTRESNVKEVS